MAKAPQDTESRHADKYIVRFPDGMRDLITEAAIHNHRSMNAEIVARLRSTFDATARASTASDSIGSVPELLRLRDLLQRTLNLVGLLQGKLREVRASLSPDETKELGELLIAIHHELDKAEPVEEMLDRLEELATEVDQIQEALLALGVASTDSVLTDAARQQLATMRATWAQRRA